MAAHTEIIAILSSGVSFKRMLFPFFIGSLVVAIITFILNGWVIPNSNKSMVAFELQYFKAKYNYDKRDVHIQIAPNTIMYLQSYQNVTKTGYHFTLDKYEGNRLIEKLTASRIIWDSTIQKWTVFDWKVMKIDSVFEKFASSGESLTDSLANGIKNNTPLDTALTIHPSEFESDYRKYEGLTFNELSDYIDTLKARGAAGIDVYYVELHSRIASTFTIFILVFMGVIVSSRKSRGGTGLQIALGFLLSFIFIVFFMLFRTFAETGAMPPQIAVWIPNIIFAVIALGMYKVMPR
jgi:lipopolysaccharide export system permease protein